MTEADKAGRVFSWRRVVFSALGCGAVAFGVGCGAGLAGFGEAVVSWLLVAPFLAILAGVFGYLSRRMYIGTLGTPVLSLAAAVGFDVVMALPLHGPDVLFYVGLPTSLLGLLSVLPAALGGLIGDLGIDGMLHAMGPRRDHKPAAPPCERAEKPRPASDAPPRKENQ